jgi:HD-GYP domain-containing protein (c-di-GMP phosphodiesterase class II)
MHDSAMIAADSCDPAKRGEKGQDGQGQDGRGPGDSPFHVLSQFTRALQRCERSSEQRRLFLQTVQEAVRAVTVFSWDRSRPESAELIGDRRVSPAWCAALASRLLVGHHDGDGHLLSSQAGGTGPEGGSSVSAAFVRVSRTPGQWVGALRFESPPFGADDVEVMSLARQLLAEHHRHSRLYGELKETVLGLVRSFTTAIDAKDRYTCGHSERVARIATRLGQEMGLPGAVVSDLYLAGLLHDIGKIGIRDSVLLKEGELNEEEKDHVREHPVIGDRIVSSIRQLTHLRPGVRNHHERYDGTGYPDRLAGEDIPLLARVLAVADACDAMMADRPYRRGLPVGRIDAVMLAGAGKQWDPAVIGHFMTCRHELYAICQKGLGQSVCAAVEGTMDAYRDQAADEFLS